MRKETLISIVAVAALALASCGGGGGGGGGVGGGGGGGGGLPSPDPLAGEQSASIFENTEDFDPCILEGFCDFGLGQIDAADVYAKGAYGDGVIVAVVDSGIDTAHIELDSQISGASTDIAAPGTPLDDELGHGTMVAGVIAAERNDIGTHGVAFGSAILALRIDGRNPDGSSTETFTITDVTAAISFAAGKAHVINLSLGAPGTQLGDPFGTPEEQAVFEQALIDAMAADAIIVVSAGNEGATEASLPSAYAGDTTVNASGQMVAVGAVNNAANALASFSNHFGLVMNYCLVAPGDGLWTTVPVDYRLDKSIVRESGRVSLVPTGRELDLQLAYDTPVGGAARLSGWLMMQLEPGHVASADPAYGFGMRFRAAF